MGRGPVAVLIALTLAVPACVSGSSASAPTEPLRTPPPVTGEVVLTVTAGGTEVAWDLGGLRQLGAREVTLFEPFLEHDETFDVVDLDAVLRTSGITSGRLHLRALDDYTTDMTVDQVRTGGALLAISAGGEPIAVADGGPTRVVFPDDSDLGRNEDLWIWSVATIEDVP